jgi:hypothetical protein
MDRIEPIAPSPPAIAPVDATQAKVRGPRREERSEAERRRESEARAREAAEQHAGEDERGEDDDTDHPRVDVRA